MIHISRNGQSLCSYWIYQDFWNTLTHHCHVAVCHGWLNLPLGGCHGYDGGGFGCGAEAGPLHLKAKWENTFIRRHSWGGASNFRDIFTYICSQIIKQTIKFSPSPFSLGPAWLSDSPAASITLGSWSLRRRRERRRRSPPMPSLMSASASSPSPSSREYGLLSGSLSTAGDTEH